jgi:pimeloyl-ACP methyl ester carboxylesterase
VRVVFVHGALVRDGAWWWRRTAEALAAQGIASSSALLPSCGETGTAPSAAGPGFVDDVVSTRSALLEGDGPVVAVGHSYGGTVLTEAAAGLDVVERLVYVSSFLAEVGESHADFGGPGGPPPWIDVQDGIFALKPDYAESHYLHDCLPEDVAPAIDRLVKQSLAVTVAPVKSAAWQGIPSTYVVCTEDRGTSAELQRSAAGRASRIVELPSGHHPFLSMPERMAELVSAP